MQVSTNGLISVHEPETSPVPRNFPTTTILIAPFWADADTSNGAGAVSYGVTRDAAQLTKAGGEITAAHPELTEFTPLYLFIATWNRVGYYNREGIATTSVRLACMHILFHVRTVLCFCSVTLSSVF